MRLVLYFYQQSRTDFFSQIYYFKSYFFLYQFQLSKDKGVFRCIPNTGKINPKEEISVRFIFVPTETIVYYRRIHLLIHEVVRLSFLNCFELCICNFKELLFIT